MLLMSHFCIDKSGEQWYNIIEKTIKKRGPLYMTENAVKAKLDIVFKQIFSTNEDLLKALLSALLSIPEENIRELHVNNTEMLPDSPDFKYAYLDLNIQVDDRLVNIELQVENDNDFIDRTLFYWSRLYTRDLKKGHDYDELKQTLSINILDFNLFDCEEFHSAYKLMEEKRHEVLTDKCAIHFFELKKISGDIDARDKMNLWLNYIKAETEEELTMLDNTGVPEIKKAVDVIRDLNKDREMRQRALEREMLLHDKASALGKAERDGIEKGMAMGMAKGVADTVEKMRRGGMTEEQIKRILNM